jgi:hypothetical protein
MEFFPNISDIFLCLLTTYEREAVPGWWMESIAGNHALLSSLFAMNTKIFLISLDTIMSLPPPVENANDSSPQIRRTTLVFFKRKIENEFDAKESTILSMSCFGCFKKSDPEVYSVDGRRCIRVYPEPADRSVEDEIRAAEELQAHHKRRLDEEIAISKASYDRHCEGNARFLEKKRAMLSENKDADTLLANFIYDVEMSNKICQEHYTHYIRKFTIKRTALSWTCPNDGRAYEFLWEGQHYLRTHKGEIWRDDAPDHPIPILGAWMGRWTGYYINYREPAPQL